MGLFREMRDFAEFLERWHGMTRRAKITVVCVGVLVWGGPIVGAWFARGWVSDFHINALKARQSELETVLEARQKLGAPTNNELRKDALDLVVNIQDGISVAHVALGTGIFSPEQFLRLERYQVHAKVLRDEILLRIPASPQDQEAAKHYHAKVAVNVMSNIANLDFHTPRLR